MFCQSGMRAVVEIVGAESNSKTRKEDEGEGAEARHMLKKQATGKAKSTRLRKVPFSAKVLPLR